MRVIDQNTGEPYHLDVTQELQADLGAHHDSSCTHQQTEIRRRKNKGGALHFYRQCLACGASVGMAIKRSPELEKSPDWDDDREKQYVAARKSEYDAITQKHVRKQKNGDEGSTRKYDTYLSSPAWRAKRAKVLKRANGICEGCLERKATQVHHLTYDHIFEEFFFELIAICDECHERLHSEKRDENKPAETILTSEWEAHWPCDGCRHGGEEDHRRWCFILDQYAADALAPGGDCGPTRSSFEPLK